MKRALALAFLIGVCVFGFLSIRGTLPYMPVFGTSMEPVLHAGNLIIIENISPDEVEVGDIIVFSVPSSVREYYNYPPVVAHRVIEVNTEHGVISYRTKGDNTGEDPFGVRPQDLKGKVGNQISYLGFPLLFMQSNYGLIFVICALCVLALYLYAGEIGQARRRTLRGVLAPAIEESQRGSQIIAKKIEGTEQRLNSTEQALSNFTSAMNEYAQHLASHTAAVRELAGASKELRSAAQEQNRFFSQLAGAYALKGTMADAAQRGELAVSARVEMAAEDVPERVTVEPVMKKIADDATEKEAYSEAAPEKMTALVVPEKVTALVVLEKVTTAIVPFNTMVAAIPAQVKSEAVPEEMAADTVNEESAIKAVPEEELATTVRVVPGCYRHKPTAISLEEGLAPPGCYKWRKMGFSKDIEAMKN